MSEIKVNTITKRTGSTLTIGESGTTVTLETGASQSGFGAIDWQSVQTSSFYSRRFRKRSIFVNTTSSAIICNYYYEQRRSAGDKSQLKIMQVQQILINVTVKSWSSMVIIFKAQRFQLGK